MDNHLLTTRHVAQHCDWVEHVGVAAQIFSKQHHILEFVRTDSRFSCFMLLTKDQARPPDNCLFQHFIGLFTGGIQL